MVRLAGFLVFLSLVGCTIERNRSRNNEPEPEPEPEPERPQWAYGYSKRLKYGPRIPEMHAAALQAIKANGWRIEDEGRYKDDLSDIEAFKHNGQSRLKWHAGRHDHRTVTTLEIVSNRITNYECKDQFRRIHDHIANVVGERGDD